VKLFYSWLLVDRFISFVLFDFDGVYLVMGTVLQVYVEREFLRVCFVHSNAL